MYYICNVVLEVVLRELLFEFVLDVYAYRVFYDEFKYYILLYIIILYIIIFYIIILYILLNSIF